MSQASDKYEATSPEDVGVSDATIKGAFPFQGSPDLAQNHDLIADFGYAICVAERQRYQVPSMEDIEVADLIAKRA